MVSYFSKCDLGDHNGQQFKTMVVPIVMVCGEWLGKGDEAISA